MAYSNKPCAEKMRDDRRHARCRCRERLPRDPAFDAFAAGLRDRLYRRSLGARAPILWWPVAAGLAFVYAMTVIRKYPGKVRLADGDHSPY